MSDNIKRPRMHAYVDDDGSMIAHKNGVNIQKLYVSEVDAGIAERWALEGMLAAFQLGADYDDICDGSALPKGREKPKPGNTRTAWAHKPNKIQQAVANVRSLQLWAQARERGEKQPRDFYDAAALDQAMKLTKEQLKEAARNKDVAAEMIALAVQRKPEVSLDALFSAAA